MSDRARAHLVQMGDQAAAQAQAFVQLWAQTKPRLNDPVMLDRFGLAASNVTEAIGLASGRAHELAAALLDDGD